MFRQTALLVLFVLLSSALFAETALVERVVDGDTVVLEDKTRVRLIGIDAPEIENQYYGHRGEPYGEEARVVLTQLAEGRRVELKDGPEKYDRYQRRLAYLYLPDQSLINRKMIETGAAEAYRKFDHPLRGEFIQLEQAAKQKKLGMWAIERKPPTWWERLWGKRK